MNNIDNHVPFDGILLTDNVDLDWLRSVEPVTPTISSSLR